MLKQALHSYLSVSSLLVKLWNMTQGLVVAININNLPTFHSSVIQHRLFLATFNRLIQSFRQFKMGNEFWFEQPLHNSRKWKRQGNVSTTGHCSQRWLPLMSSNISCTKTSRHSSIYLTTNTSMLHAQTVQYVFPFSSCRNLLFWGCSFDTASHKLPKVFAQFVF